MPFHIGIDLTKRYESTIMDNNGTNTLKQENVVTVSAGREWSLALNNLTVLKLLKCIAVITVERELKWDTVVQHGTAQVIDHTYSYP